MAGGPISLLYRDYSWPICIIMAPARERAQRALDVLFITVVTPRLGNTRPACNAGPKAASRQALRKREGEGKKSLVATVCATCADFSAANHHARAMLVTS